MNRKKGGLWKLLSIVWIAVILFLSAQGGDDSHSLSYNLTRFIGGVLHPDFASWSSMVQTEWINGVEELIRKLAHYFEFALLGVFAYLAIDALMRGAKRRKPFNPSKSAFITFYVCAAIATASELIQIFADNRNAGAADVALDCFGILSGMAFILLKTKQRRNTRSTQTKTVLRHRKG